MLKFSSNKSGEKNNSKKSNFLCSQGVLRFPDQGEGMQVLSSPFINIDSRRLGSEAVNKIIEEIKQFKKIKTLLLAENEIDDSSIDTIVGLISNPEISLEVLDLLGNDISDVGARKLLAAAQKKESLRELILIGNPKVSKACIKEIEELMAQRKPASSSKKVKSNAPG